MKKIEHFVQVRADGKLIPATMAVSEMLALGWEPSKVVALRWTNNDQHIEIEASSGIHGIVVPGENFVAALYDENVTDFGGNLIIFLADGSMHGQIGSPVAVAERNFNGIFSWFEPAITSRMDTFGAVFQAAEQVSLRCDIDANAVALVNVVKIH